MRVIAGAAKGHRLHSAPGDRTRPITDRAKEALFNILGPGVEGARMLDLFGGTGAVGIEALSRGAEEVVFVEKSGAVLSVLKRNLRETGLAERAQVVRGDAFKYLAQEDVAPFDYIFVAPPQYQGLWRKALQMIDARPQWLTAEGEIIVQIHPKEFETISLKHLQHFDSRRYGSVRLDFYRAAS